MIPVSQLKKVPPTPHPEQLFPFTHSKTTKSPCFSGNHKNNNARKIAGTNEWQKKRERNWNQNPQRKSCKYENKAGLVHEWKEEKLNTKQKKSNKCLLTTIPSGTELTSHSLLSCLSHCSFSTLFAYELWIENWSCDFPSVDHLSLQLAIFLVAVLSLLCFCAFFMRLFGRYRNMIVSSTLEDSYDLISISD